MQQFSSVLITTQNTLANYPGINTVTFHMDILEDVQVR